MEGAAHDVQMLGINLGIDHHHLPPSSSHAALPLLLSPMHLCTIPTSSPHTLIPNAQQSTRLLAYLHHCHHHHVRLIYHVSESAVIDAPYDGVWTKIKAFDFAW